MQYLELSAYHHNLPRPMPRVRNFGWLSAASDFPTGATPPLVLEKLKALAINHPVALERGITACPICRKDVRAREGKLLGIAEVWVPEKDIDAFFAAPDLVVHYIEDHGYRPPDEVVIAIEAMDVLLSGPTLDRRREDMVAELFKV